ncbi:hypothetical protein DMH26_29895 [Streptomyces sp. WAC 05379]|nr:hypothetical protein DMH26_29895 [Streptomyces sp. WAC 05379]
MCNDHDLFSRWLADRRSAVQCLRNLLMELAKEIQAARSGNLGRATRSVVNHLALHGASIFLTVLFDEYAFDQVEGTLWGTLGTATRNYLYDHVLTSRQSLNYLAVPPSLMNLKRITIPLRETFLPAVPDDISPGSRNSTAPVDTVRSFSEEEWRCLSVVRSVYDASEELSVIWVGVITLLSTSLTLLFHADLLESMQRGESKLIDHLPEG